MAKKKAAPKAPKALPTTGIVDTAILNVRKEPSQDAKILRQLVKGTKIDILGRHEGWLESADGYVMEKCVR